MSLGSYYFMIFGGFGVIAGGVILSPMILGACLHGAKGGIVLGCILGLLIGLVYSTAIVQGTKSGIIAGNVYTLLLAPVAFSIGVGLTTLWFPICIEISDYFLTTLRATLSFTVILLISNMLWFLFRTKVWKSR